MANPSAAKSPLYEPEEVPRIKNAKRLTKTRTKQLVKAAARDVDDPPPKPGLGECCGSSCDPCVNDLWGEELACWRERWGVDADGKGADGKEVKEVKKKMPGSFDW
ncbi:hypothetical protein ASPSYDRAFT_28580 [Aspergillus sydowii CBS 593.65]|uniref:Oxidoreductase-like domain-containing protein n=1 Tax=Aspergillus sydowii CBS 593.65 TaxID=1036612 RepID=A0A1L9TU25_9EURO|nr:uncharacterized protein ASPSYDRAFT_28580 [Aspergillus sydowii CBS 593.65]OJJ62970.1 hypothetical protein ASPSYDRAFT_28580 [Aspergillus sydowii CBS 593.65]